MFGHGLPRNTLSSSLHDLGLSAWFGGTLANAVALNPASAQATTASTTGAVANSGWDRWTPANAAAIGAHLVGSVGQLVGNRQRMAAQKGADAQRQLDALQWAVPALTGALVVISAFAGAQQRPQKVRSGVKARVGRRH